MDRDAVKCTGDANYITLSPRTKLTAAPYALYSLNSWALNGNSGTGGNGFIGTTDNAALTIGVNGQAALRIYPQSQSPNLIGGYSGNTVLVHALRPDDRGRRIVLLRKPHPARIRHGGRRAQEPIRWLRRDDRGRHRQLGQQRLRHRGRRTAQLRHGQTLPALAADSTTWPPVTWPMSAAAISTSP